jgi:hypothetical protein
MVVSAEKVAEAIDNSPLNRGLSGAVWLASAGNIPVTFDNGDIALFDHEGGKDYQVHFLFNSRGREAIKHARESFRIMFTQHDAELIFGLRRDVKLLARWAGGKFAGKRATSEGVCELYVLSNLMFFKGKPQ